MANFSNGLPGKLARWFVACIAILFLLSLVMFALSGCTFSVGTENGKFVSQIKGNKSVTIDEKEYKLDTLTGCYCPIIPKQAPYQELYHNKQ